MNFESYNPNKLLLIPYDKHELTVIGGPSNRNIPMYNTRLDYSLVRRGDEYLK